MDSAPYDEERRLLRRFDERGSGLSLFDDSDHVEWRRAREALFDCSIR
jgi:hypothetical protein